ncbi:MAG: OmpW/AlkL family protein [Telluria sp.]
MNAQRVIKLLALGAAMAVATGAQAQSAGQWAVEVGVNKITPQVKSGDVSAPALPHSQASIGPDTEPVFYIRRGITDNISAELDLGTGYNHTLYGAGAIQGTGRLGEAQVLPPTLFAQYRFFEPSAGFRPYVGAGITYAWFRKTTGSGQMTALTNTGGPATTFKIDNKVAGTLQLGVDYNFGPKYFASLAYTKTWLKTQVHFSTGQWQDMTLDPKSVSFSLGYKF